MKTSKLTICFLTTVSFFTQQVWSRPVDLSAPTGGLGASNAKGFLEIWREVDGIGIHFGKSSFLPLRYRFSSDESSGGILGPGFYMPLLEARSALIREQVMRAYLPCGKGLYFWKDSVDSSKFITPDKEWTGLVSGDDFTVSRDDGWTILYHSGRLSSIRTDEGHVFKWDYDPITHMVTNINKDGQAIVAIERNEQGLLGAIVIEGKRFEMDYAERPLTQVLHGQPLIKDLAWALSSFKYPDGKTDNFKFVLSQQLAPTLTFTDRDQKQTVYTWDVATNHLATELGADTNWTYKVGDTSQPFGSPPISRTNSQGLSEGIIVDNRLGTYTRKTLDGTSEVTHVFETPGPLYHKVHEVEELNGNATRLIYRASYDEQGHKIRSIDNRGYITSFTYNALGKKTREITSLPTDPLQLNKIQDRAVQLQNILANATDQSSRQDAMRTLIQFYMFDLPDSIKAAAIFPKLDHAHSFVILLQQIDINSTLTAEDKIQKYQNILKIYPEYKDRLEFLMDCYKKKIE